MVQAGIPHITRAQTAAHGNKNQGSIKIYNLLSFFMRKLLTKRNAHVYICAS
jgi:hypothetical protein